MVKFIDLLKEIFIPYNIEDAYNQGDITLSEQHLTVIRNLNFTWLNIESGAIAAYFPVFEPVGQLLKLSENSNALRKIMSEALCAFPLWLSRSDCDAGIYKCEKDKQQPFLFELTEQHIQLIHHFIWREMRMNDGIVNYYFNNYPLPLAYTDGKRPFGDRTYYQQDMRDILGQDIFNDLELEKLFRTLDNAMYIYVRHATSQ